MSEIEVKNLTKDYGNRKGIFDISFSVEKGKVFGFLGPNGSGKTTTIRHLMGFINQKGGSCTIKGLNCKKDAKIIQKNLGYIAGEPAFINSMGGIEFIEFLAKYRGLKDLKKAKELIEEFQLNPKGPIRKMSKGMKQKIAIVCAFMHNPEILILDEPTSGLDPIMQNKFIELILKEKSKGKTILMSSHMFEEVEKTCDEIGIIRQGEIVAIDTVASLKASQIKKFNIDFAKKDEALAFAYNISNTNAKSIKIISVDGTNVSTAIKDADRFIKLLSQYKIDDLRESNQSLEEIFLNYYGEKNISNEVYND